MRTHLQWRWCARKPKVQAFHWYFFCDFYFIFKLFFFSADNRINQRRQHLNGKDKKRRRMGGICLEFDLISLTNYDVRIPIPMFLPFFGTHCLIFSILVKIKFIKKTNPIYSQDGKGKLQIRYFIESRDRFFK